MKRYFLLFIAISSMVYNTNLLAKSNQYDKLDYPVSGVPDVVEFFSFYCKPCYQFIERYPVIDSVNYILPAGQTVTKYHVSAMGPMGKSLTEAWAIACTLGVAHQIEKPIFIAVQQHGVTSVEDIKTIFSQAGISHKQYENAQHSMVIQSLVAQQDAMVEKFQIRGTPSFYIKGKYHINNGAFQASTPDEYVENFTHQVAELLKK